MSWVSDTTDRGWKLTEFLLHCTSGVTAPCKSAPAISAWPARIETYCRSARSSTLASEPLGDPLAHRLERQRLARNALVDGHDVKAIARLDELAQNSRRLRAETAPFRIPARCRRGRSDRDCRRAVPMGSSRARAPARRTDRARAASSFSVCSARARISGTCTDGVTWNRMCRACTRSPLWNSRGCFS